ncbi:MAG: dTDP-4-dehydrorhamnose reductase [Clostridiales bacterium]|nr:dTDP-4-dehydrorhamnose reductase [Clostridiales bacterium]
MKIALLGGEGQLGQTLKKALAQKKTSIGKIDAAYQQAEVFSLDLPETDITNYPALAQKVEEISPQIIINCAALTNVDACETEQTLAMQVNSLGARNVAMAGEKVGAKVIHVSTDYVFDGKGTHPYQEWDLCNPTTVYGKSKHLGEEYVAAFSTKYFIVRTAWLYGEEGGNFVKTMLRLGKEKEEITVVNDQIGNPTNAQDLAHHLLKMALTQQYGLYHCTGKGIISWYDFAAKIMSLSGSKAKVLPCTTAQYPRPAQRPAYSALGHHMLESTIGDDMRYWEEALEEYLQGII